MDPAALQAERRERINTLTNVLLVVFSVRFPSRLQDIMVTLYSMHNLTLHREVLTCSSTLTILLHLGYCTCSTCVCSSCNCCICCT